MKKIATLFFLLCLCLLTSKNNQPVFLEGNSEKANNDYQLVHIKLNNVTTENIVSIFNNVVVIKIYPKFNIIYKDKIKDTSYFHNNYIDDLKDFKKWYSKTIKNYENSIEQTLLGVPIDAVDIYLSNSEYQKLKVNNSDFIFSKIDI